MNTRLPSGALGARTVVMSALAVGVAIASALAAQLLIRLIGLITNLSFYGRWSSSFVSPAGNTLGLWVIGVPVIGGVLVGILARYGSPAIRGHGIPEAMEQVLYNRSRIAPRLTFLKPLSAAIAIGTGGPFGAEGPIIATGGAIGSLVGQLLHTTADERKILLAAGAAAGMAATFGSPVAAVLLAVELLLFEYRGRSIVPVALASVAATAIRIAFNGSAPIFPLPNLLQPGGEALAFYCVIGAVVGVFSSWVTAAVYAVEDAFEHLHLHWMWWPAIGAVAVGICGYFSPHTLGVGYDNIDRIASGGLLGRAMIVFVILKFVSWAISLGSGTSGGTLAPLFTIGAGLGSILGMLAGLIAPAAGIDFRIGALVGMAAIFAGASRALLASVVFAFEVTRQPVGLLPLLGGCTAAYLVSSLLSRTSIMTEKIARRGAHVPTDYAADFLDTVLVRDAATSKAATLRAEDTLAQIIEWIALRGADSLHQGYLVVDAQDRLLGVITRRDFLDPGHPGSMRVGELVRKAAILIGEEQTLREAADEMVRQDVGRLVVVSRKDPSAPRGILTRGDVLAAHAQRLADANDLERGLTLFGRRSAASDP